MWFLWFWLVSSIVCTLVFYLRVIAIYLSNKEAFKQAKEKNPKTLPDKILGTIGIIILMCIPFFNDIEILYYIFTPNEKFKI